MKKKILAVALSMVLIMTFVPASAFASTSDPYTKVTGSYKKLTYGSLTKTQVEAVLDSLISQSKRGSKPLYLSAKKINKMGKNHFVNRIALMGAKWYDPKPGQFSSSKPIDWWCEAHPLKQSNRILSFYTSYRYKKSAKKKNGSEYVWRTNKKKLYFYGGIGWMSGCKIKSAKKNSKKMILTVERYDYFSGEGSSPIGKYKVVLKKQKNGRYKLYSIKETWIDSSMIH